MSVIHDPELFEIDGRQVELWFENGHWCCIILYEDGTKGYCFGDSKRNAKRQARKQVRLHRGGELL